MFFLPGVITALVPTFPFDLIWHVIICSTGLLIGEEFVFRNVVFRDPDSKFNVIRKLLLKSVVNVSPELLLCNLRGNCPTETRWRLNVTYCTDIKPGTRTSTG